MPVAVEPLDLDFPDGPDVRGDLHTPEDPNGDAVVLTHGAGGDRNAALLAKLCETFAGAGVTALRCDLPYRQKRPKGPPSPSGAVRDREGLRRAVTALRRLGPKRLFLGGTSYGGRQASMLAAETEEAADGLLLLSYPLHPPGKPERLRTDHFPQIEIPTLFAHGSKDSFGTIEELRAALALITAPHELVVFEGATHGIITSRSSAAKAEAAAERVVSSFLGFFPPVE